MDLDTTKVYYLLAVFGAIVVSMTLHEAMHAFAGYWLGDDTARAEGRLTLNPIAHIDPVTTIMLPLFLAILGLPPFGAAKPVPFNPHRVRFGDYGAAIVGAVGPLTNLLLAMIASLAIHATTGINSALLADILVTFAIVNVSFFVFNLIPFPPLDGSRIVYAFAPDAVRSFMESIEAMGFMAVLLFMTIFYLFLINPFTAIVQNLVYFIT